jgi:hypothetical protein
MVFSLALYTLAPISPLAQSISLSYVTNYLIDESFLVDFSIKCSLTAQFGTFSAEEYKALNTSSYLNSILYIS